MEEDKVVIHLHKPDLNEKLFFCISGIIVSIPITLFVNALSSHLCFFLPIFYSEVCTSALLVPFIEEFSKAYPLFYRHGETERSTLVLGFLIGLGFGITEYFMYVFGSGASVFIRLPAIFFHASSTSITAYGIATKRPVVFYLVAVALHFSNNLLAVTGQLWLIGGPAVMLVTYYLAWYFYSNAAERIVK